jgi:DNA-binding MarR family transcriptional regulator
MEYLRDESIGWLVYKARYMLKKRLQNKLKDFGISSEQWSVITVVHTKKGCNQITLAEILLKDGATITRILNILETKQLITRENSSNDKREFLIYMTEKGNELYNEASQVVSQNTEGINSIFSVDELEQLEYLLNKLVSNL